jgi:hypothetical protein
MLLNIDIELFLSSDEDFPQMVEKYFKLGRINRIISKHKQKNKIMKININIELTDNEKTLLLISRINKDNEIHISDIYLDEKISIIKQRYITI